MTRVINQVGLLSAVAIVPSDHVEDDLSPLSSFSVFPGPKDFLSLSLASGIANSTSVAQLLPFNHLLNPGYMLLNCRSERCSNVVSVHREDG